MQGQFDTASSTSLSVDPGAEREDLKSALHTVPALVIGIEGRRLGSSPSVTKAQYPPSAQTHPQAQQTQHQQQASLTELL